MLITSRNVAFYLNEAGLLGFDSIVDGDFLVVDMSRRNRNLKVIRKNQPSYFVKQISNWEPQAIATLQREANCYWLAQQDPHFAPLAELTPKFYNYDPGRYILVVELLPQGENVTEYHQRLGKFPLDIAVLMGRALGAYHRRVRVTPDNDPRYSAFPKMVPWILSLHKQNPYGLPGISAANSQMVGILQKYPEFQQCLEALAGRWEINSLIHGDMKWENCIVYHPEGAQGPLALKVVDWEMADFGDGCWDVGAILQAYLTFWIMSMRIAGDQSPEQFVGSALYPLEGMQPAIQVFWKTYCDQLEAQGSKARELLERCVQYGAARMIQTVFEYSNQQPQLSANALAMLQVCSNILVSPREAIRDLLGL